MSTVTQLPRTAVKAQIYQALRTERQMSYSWDNTIMSQVADLHNSSKLKKGLIR